MYFPSGEFATNKTMEMCLKSGAPTASPVSALQIRTILSNDPDTIRFPSDEIATDKPMSVCHRNGAPVPGDLSPYLTLAT